MKTPLHVFRLHPAPTQRDSESVQIVVGRGRKQWGLPLFRAPALPTPHQISSELPFTVNFRARIRAHT